MANDGTTKAKADTLAKQLQASLSKRRFQPWKVVLGALLLSVIGLGVIAYWYYPRAQPAPLQILALDMICTPDEAPRARAQLFAPPDDIETRRWNGHAIVFHEPRLPLQPAENPREVSATTETNGRASADWPVGKATITEYFAKYIDADQRYDSTHGRIFVWPKDASLLVVDVDATLIAADLDANASTTLTRAAKEGWRVVYLAPKGETPHDLRAACAWIAKHQAKLPIGPVLGRPHFSDADSADAARQAALQSLKERFTGPMRTVLTAADWANVAPPK